MMTMSMDEIVAMFKHLERRIEALEAQAKKPLPRWPQGPPPDPPPPQMPTIVFG